MNKNYDLEERTNTLAKKIIVLLKETKVTLLNKRIIPQVVGSCGSIGANYCEANEAESKRDFVHKIALAKKEIKETIHWLKLLEVTNPEIAVDLCKLRDESYQLLLIFSKIIRSSKKLIIK